MKSIVSRLRASTAATQLQARLSRYPQIYYHSRSLFVQLLRIYYLLRTGHLLSTQQIMFPLGVTNLVLTKQCGLAVSVKKNELTIYEPAVPFRATYEEPHDFEGKTSDVTVLAYHLPQFHATPENDQWWGAGFTEWTNTRKARPLFPGHYQPREPHDDIGYYDLSKREGLRQQAQMAKKHGIHGFAFYHYWFHGKRMLGKPVDLLLKNPDIDIGFCLCWANETWSKRWDGKDHEILIQQTFSPENDIEFIKFLAPYFCDSRYVRVEGKPLLQVYRVSKLPSAKKTAERWRRWCRENGIGEIHLVAVAHSETPISSRALKRLGFDAYAAFVPHRFPCPPISDEEGLFEGGHRFDYGSGVEHYCAGEPAINMYECCTLGWDNTARFGRRANIYLNFSIRKYYEWLVEALRRTRTRFPVGKRIMFINAWNEWAEGVYLEPDKLYGYAYLNATSKAIFGMPFGSENDTLAEKKNSAEKYSKDYEWLKNTVKGGAENSLTKVNAFLQDRLEILEFGPAAGYFTRFLKEERSATVDVVEIDSKCAAEAAVYARQCVIADLEQDNWGLELGDKRYDCAIFADVLEHLRDPLKVLRRAAEFVRPGGKIIISVPNLGHWQIIASLINNDFSYNQVGIMDHTHTHFFTEPTLRELIQEAGLELVDVTEVRMPHLPVGCGTKWNKFHVPWSVKRFLKRRPFAEAIQIVAVGRKP
jgi:2-polyprenyl-3-methyl-5-hydroxy-6-metoxy-1,4-benzoquinol methylase